MDYGFRRPKEPWEASDGAVYLLRELAQVGLNPAHANQVSLKHHECTAFKGSLVYI